jgi:DNA-binding MltR family transcriptional regulator
MRSARLSLGYDGASGNSMPKRVNEFFNLYLDEVMDFRESLSAETDRGCALMAAAYLDHQLVRLFKAVLVQDAAVQQQLLQPLGPMGSFSSRIEMAYGIGLLSEVVRRNLRLVRKIRNEFGHVAKPLAFTDGPIADRCRRLDLTPLEIAASPRHRFTSTVMGLAAALHHSIHTATRNQVPPDVVWSEEQKRGFREKAAALSDLLFGEGRVPELKAGDEAGSAPAGND